MAKKDSISIIQDDESSHLELLEEPLETNIVKKEVKTVDDVLKTINGAKEVVSIEKGTVNLVMVFDHEAIIKKNERRIKRLYILEKDGNTVKEVDIDALVKILVAKTKEGISIEELLKEAFIKTPPDVLLEAYKRILVKKKKVVAGSGMTGSYSHCCYSLLIPGDKGEKRLEIIINK